jgi:2-oxoglutarate ferredoxin oxidoreductase subunit beta
MIFQGMGNKGFSFIEAITQCPIAYGRKNKLGDAPEMLKWMSETAVMKAAYDKLPEEKREGKFPIGVFYNSEFTEYTTAYQKVIDLAGGAR